jgi:hypothetical protein
MHENKYLFRRLEWTAITEVLNAYYMPYFSEPLWEWEGLLDLPYQGRYVK